MPVIHLSIFVIEDRVLYNLTYIEKNVLKDGEVEQGSLGCHLADIGGRYEARGNEMVPYL